MQEQNPQLIFHPGNRAGKPSGQVIPQRVKVHALTETEGTMPQPRGRTSFFRTTPHFHDMYRQSQHVRQPPPGSESLYDPPDPDEPRTKDRLAQSKSRNNTTAEAKTQVVAGEDEVAQMVVPSRRAQNRLNRAMQDTNGSEKQGRNQRTVVHSPNKAWLDGLRPAEVIQI